jgi:hypothetical protein
MALATSYDFLDRSMSSIRTVVLAAIGPPVYVLAVCWPEPRYISLP